MRKAFADNTVVVIDCPVDYRENMKLTERLKKIGESVVAKHRQGKKHP
jgi:acetolactate synthase-1/2/3 large subunit